MGAPPPPKAPYILCSFFLTADPNLRSDSGTGWPSFWDPVDDNVKLEKGNFLSFMFGTECKCRKCDGHLGHRFDDGPIMKTGKRYCINGAALRFRESIGAGPPPDTFPDAPPL